MSNFTFKCDINGVQKEFEIIASSLSVQRESMKIYNQAFSDAVKSGSIVRAKLDDLLRDQGLWNESKDIEFVTLQKQILEKERLLAKGGISLKQARSIAIEMKNYRLKLRDLISVKTELDTHTAEGQADNARFNYLVSQCVVYKDTKKAYFNSYEDYLNRNTDLVAILGAQKLASIMYGLDSDFEKKLPENKFLIKYKLVDDNLNYVDDQKRRVDEDGRLIDANGRFINEQGQFVDKDGNLVDVDGEYIVEFQPFLDENGKPILEESSQDESSDNDPPKTSDK
jgi:hypothetical protein